MSGGSKFSAEVPKGDAWGVEQAVAAAAAEFQMTGRSPMIPVVGVIGIKEIKLSSGDDGPTSIPVVKVFRIESLTTAKAIREGQKLILRALQDRAQGTGAEMLPFEEAEVLKMAFGDVDIDKIEQDEREQIEDENISELDRLRRHLVAVHGHDQAEIDGLETVDVRQMHDAEHDVIEADEDSGVVPAHDREWWAWRRVEVAEAELNADDDVEGSTVPDDARSLTGDDPEGETAGTEDDGDDELPDNVRPLFDDGDQAADNGTEH